MPKDDELTADQLIEIVAQVLKPKTLRFNFHHVDAPKSVKVEFMIITKNDSPEMAEASLALAKKYLGPKFIQDER